MKKVFKHVQSSLSGKTSVLGAHAMGLGDTRRNMGTGVQYKYINMHFGMVYGNIWAYHTNRRLSNKKLEKHLRI